MGDKANNSSPPEVTVSQAEEQQRVSPPATKSNSFSSSSSSGIRVPTPRRGVRLSSGGLSDDDDIFVDAVESLDLSKHNDVILEEKEKEEEEEKKASPSTQKQPPTPHINGHAAPPPPPPSSSSEERSSQRKGSTGTTESSDPDEKDSFEGEKTFVQPLTSPKIQLKLSETDDGDDDDGPNGEHGDNDTDGHRDEDSSDHDQDEDQTENNNSNSNNGQENSSSCQSNSDTDKTQKKKKKNSHQAENNDEPPAELDEAAKAEIFARVRKQIDFYFGDDNFPKDKFLQKHASKADGFVELAVVASFKKMKKITKDIDMVIEALQTSEVVELSSDNSKLRRKHPLPPQPEDPMQRTVVIDNVQADASVDSVRALAEKTGFTVTHVRFINPSAGVLPDDLKKFIAQHAKGKVHAALRPSGPRCALVEFKTIDEATKACKELGSDKGDWRSAIRASLLHVKEKKKNKKKKKDQDRSAVTPSPHKGQGTSEDERARSWSLDSAKQQSTLEALDRLRNKKGNDPGSRGSPLAGRKYDHGHGHGHSHLSPQGSHSASNSPRSSPRPGRKHRNGGGNGSNDNFLRPIGARNSPRNSPMLSSSPWRSSSPNPRSLTESPRPNANILRSPRGPDSSPWPKGRGRPLESNTLSP
eukprot:m.8820 g.8820  ORF g.8820 m.8820 type:complete len:642 (+) comp7071_c0_seq1:248-2173(+)